MLRRRSLGVTLIELIVGIAIIGFLLLMGVPAFSTFLQNAKLRASADSVLAALQLARTEALTRNGQVEMVLTDEDPIAATVNAVAPSTTGKNWVVRYFNPTTVFYEFVQGRSSAEGSGQAEASSVVVTSTQSTIAFTGLGTTTLGASATIQFTNPTGGACAAASGPMRCLNLVVSPTGQVRMCDPSVTADGDTRKC